MNLSKRNKRAKGKAKFNRIDSARKEKNLVGKPYFKVLRNAFNLERSEIKGIIHLCVSNPKDALSIAGEFGKLNLIKPIVAHYHPKFSFK